jgi:hypothetical protein
METRLESKELLCLFPGILDSSLWTKCYDC